MDTQQPSRGRPPRYQHRTGLDDTQLSDLAAAVHAVIGPWQKPIGRPRTLGCFNALLATLFYLRRNNSQAVEGELFGCSQPTNSRYITALEPVVSVCLDDLEANVQAKAERSTLLVDGFLVPTGDLADVAGLYSGKRHDTGANAQLVTDLYGRSVDIGDPMLGSMHDATAFGESGIAKRYAAHLEPDGPGMIGDCGYIGHVPVTPVKKPEYRDLTDAEHSFNYLINRRCAAVERGIAHLRNWKILKTGYRRPLDRLAQTLHTVVKLDMYRVHPEKAF